MLITTIDTKLGTEDKKAKLDKPKKATAETAARPKDRKILPRVLAVKNAIIQTG